MAMMLLRQTDELVQQWGMALVSPRVRTFDRLQASVRWTPVWLSLVLLALVEGLGMAAIIFGPNAAAGYSSLPFGPKLHLPPTLLLPIAAAGGSILQFLLFSALLFVSARLLGGKGGLHHADRFAQSRLGAADGKC